MIEHFDYRMILLGLGILLCLQNYHHYISQILKGVFKPHMFSWAIWSLLSWIVFAAQISKDAGPGMWQTGIMGLGTGAIATLAYFKGNKEYTRSDWTALVFALSAIPLWVLTKNPLWSVILVTVIDAVASWPTIRKAWVQPQEESARIFFTCAIITGLSFFALSVLTVTTGLYPAAITIINLLIAVMILIRRKKLAQ